MCKEADWTGALVAVLAHHSPVLLRVEPGLKYVVAVWAVGSQLTLHTLDDVWAHLTVI